ncbi:SDR family NAD(P)-dependent oxidoreductase [Lysinibacillus xylanilyticus]|uniref:hypothetical protein n=1 Tax=Lysinibacillus xylanilyticus TaxID=582475 RepID=UPI003810B57F
MSISWILQQSIKTRILSFAKSHDETFYEMGALPALMAGTAPQVKGGELFGPKWFIRGYPTKEKVKSVVYDKKLSEKLWKTTEQITGIVYK